MWGARIAVAALALGLGLGLAVGGCGAAAPKRMSLGGPGQHDLERGPESRPVSSGEAAGSAELAAHPDGASVNGPAAAPAPARGVEFGGAPAAAALPADLPEVDLGAVKATHCRAPRCTHTFDASPDRLLRGEVDAPTALLLEHKGTACAFVFRPQHEPTPCCEPPARGGLVYGVVLRGVARLHPHRPPRCPRNKVCESPPAPLVPTWSAFRVPAGYELSAAQDGTVVMLAYVPREAAGRGSEAPQVVDARQAKTSVRPDGLEVRSLFDLEGGAAAMAVLRAPAGIAVPAHQHEQWFELVAVLGGEGVMELAAAPDEQQLAPHAVAPGAAFVIPPRVRHALTLRRRDPLLAIQLRVPRAR